MTEKFKCSRSLGIISEVSWIVVEVLLVNVSCIQDKDVIFPQRNTCLEITDKLKTK